MKIKLLAILSIAVCQSAFSQESKTRFGIKTGLNVSIFSASINSESSSKTGFHVGVYVRTPISEKFFFRPELYYSSQGQKDNYMIPPNGASLGKTTTTVNYMNVPLLFEVGRKFNFQFGPQLGFLLSGNEKGTVSGKTVNDDLKSIMTSTDLSLVLGLGLNATKNLSFGARFNLGLTSIFDDSQDLPPIKNQVLHFFIGYAF